jgi:farnesyl diphosphate synthase
VITDDSRPDRDGKPQDQEPDEAAAFRAAMAQDVANISQALDRLCPDEGLTEDRLPQAMRYALGGGGKRVRGLLALQTARAYGVSLERGLRLACALEALHAYSLIHDDLPAMDNSDTRRGRPTLHVLHDEATAILAGDALQALAFEILADPQTAPQAEVRAELCLGLAQASGYQGMCGGQMLDMIAESQPGFDRLTTRRLQARKTGALIAFAVEAGAILGQAALEERQALRRYADRLGLCFQITDDLLDARADAATLGKPSGQDEAKGKATFITHYGLEGAAEKAQDLTREAKLCLAPLSIKTHFLLHMADFVFERDH